MIDPDSLRAPSLLRLLGAQLIFVLALVGAASLMLGAHFDRIEVMLVGCWIAVGAGFAVGEWHGARMMAKSASEVLEAELAKRVGDAGAYWAGKTEETPKPDGSGIRFEELSRAVETLRRGVSGDLGPPAETRPVQIRIVVPKEIRRAARRDLQRALEDTPPDSSAVGVRVESPIALLPDELPAGVLPPEEAFAQFELHLVTSGIDDGGADDEGDEATDLVWEPRYCGGYVVVTPEEAPKWRAWEKAVTE